MKKETVFLLVIAFICVVFSTTIWAEDQPMLINYQSFITNSSAVPLDGTYGLTFRIYDAESGGNQLWSEIHSNVDIDDGRLSVDLGSVATLDLMFDREYWITMEVNSDGEMSPRQQLTSAPYAYKTQRSDYALNTFTLAQHNALSHANVPAVKTNTIDIAKTNFKLDAYSQSSVNLMNDLVIDTFQDTSGIDDTASSEYGYQEDEAVISCASGYQRPDDISNGLVSYWPLNEASGNAIDAQGSNTMVEHNSIAQAEGRFGDYSREFIAANSEYFDIDDANQTGLDLPGEFTIAFWLYRLNDNTVNTLIANKDVQNNRQWKTSVLNRKLTFGVSDNGESMPNMLMSTVVFDALQWYHCCITYKTGDIAKIYIDGVVDVTINNPTAPKANSVVTCIGARMYYGSPDAFIDARLQDFAIWHRALTESEVESLATATGQSLDTADIQSIAFEVDDIPDEAMIISEENLNGDSITYYVSRDSGTTWTEVSPNEVTDISSQPEGTSIKWRAVLEDSAELEAIAVSLN